METISFKLHEDILKKIDDSLKSLNYSNRTEFIRDAIRNKLSDVEKEDIKRRMSENLGCFKGLAKNNKTDREIRDEVGRELALEYGIKLN